MNKAELGRQLYELSRSENFDKYQIWADPVIRESSAQLLLPLIPSQTQVLAAVENGGVPLAVALSSLSRLPVVFFDKNEYTRGSRVVDKQVLVVDDLVFHGYTICKVVRNLRVRKATVSSAMCLWLRNPQNQVPPIITDLNVKLISLFTNNDFPQFRD